MPDWKRVRINFPTVKLGQFIEPIKETIAEKGSEDFKMVYGVTNVEGITITGKKASKDISNYIVIDKNYFAYNPYRINVGSIGFNSKGLKGCVSPAYVVFRAKNNLSPGFLYVYLKSEFGNHLINWYGNRGGVRNALRYDDLCEIDIPDIDYKTQIELLNKIDRSKIPLNSFSEEITQQLGHLKQLRQRILQEAIEGKLTAEWRKQNPKLISGDNRASKLLEKIKDEKERLVKEGKIKKDSSRAQSRGKPLAPIADAEKPFDLPEGWVWCRLGELLRISSGDGLTSKEMAKGGDFPVFGGNGINGYHDKFNISKKTIVIGRVGAQCGSVHVTPEEAWVTDNAFITYYHEHYLSGDWLAKLLTALNLRKRARETAQPVISGKRVYPIVTALPTMAEQQSIVSRVDEFMAMLGELEKQVSERKNQADMLMQSVLREAFSR